MLWKPDKLEESAEKIEETIETAVETICNVAETDLPPSQLVIDDGKQKETPEFLKKRDGVLYQRVTKYRCSFCEEEHLIRTSFEQHVRMKHKATDIDCKDYACITNIKVPDFVKNLTFSSIRTGVINPKPKTNKIKVKAELYKHTDEASKRFICDICGQGFIRNSYLVDHLDGHGNERKHVCKLCGKSFKRRSVLSAHKRIHTHPQYYICEHCGRAFNNGSVLRTHQYVGAMQFEIDNMYIIRLHFRRLLIHQRDQRNFACQICEMTFPLKASLNRHLARHQKRESGEKGFDCQNCSMQYRDKSSLMRHLKMKHQGKPKSQQKKSHVVMKEEIVKVQNCQSTL